MQKIVKIITGLFKSKTFYFNVLSGVLAFINELQGEKIIDPQTAIIIISIGNIFLRTLTNKSLTDK